MQTQLRSPDATLVVDRHGLISRWTPTAEAMLGWSRTDMLDASIRQSVHPEGLAHFEKVWTRLASGEAVPPYDTMWMHRDGSLKIVNTRVAALYERSGFAGAVVTLRSLCERERDELTGLPGRPELQRWLAEPIPTGMARAVAVLDLDAFALVNQTYGPDAGDDVLGELGQRLKGVSGSAPVGRWQADEFVCILDAAEPTAAMDEWISVVLQALREPFSVGGDRLYLTASAGLVTSALAPDRDLFGAATAALRAAKEAGRDRAAWFDGQLRPASDGGMRLANELRRGIERDELRLHFQPIVELTNNRLVGVESLVRWERPGVGLLPPAEFIDVAERTGQILALGTWVAQQACRTAADLAQLGTRPLSVSINLSARQLTDPGVVEMLRGALQDSNCPPSNVVIEVTETALTLDMSTAIATLKAFKTLGVSLALDDFGTGYCSLLYLKHFPVDHIKIDKTFVSGLGVNADDTAIVASTISLAHTMNITCIAEGVETVEQLALLREMGCDFAQGYLFSHPLALEQLLQWLPKQLPSSRHPLTSPVPLDLTPEVGTILRLHVESASLHTIAAALNQEGLRTPLGCRWTAQAVAKVITRAKFPAVRLPR